MPRTVRGHQVWLHRDGDLTVQWPGRGWVSLGHVRQDGPHAWAVVIPDTWSAWGRLPYVQKVSHSQRGVIEHAISYAERQNYLPPATKTPANG